MLMVSDFAWVAGVIDEKGYITRKKNKSRATPQLVLSVETRHIEIIEELSKLTGVQKDVSEEITPKEWNRRGCVEHCPPDSKHIHVNSDKWRMPSTSRWAVTGASAAIVLHNTLAFIESDKDFRETYAEILNNTVTQGQGWTQVKSVIIRLRNLGWDLPPSYKRLNLDS